MAEEFQMGAGGTWWNIIPSRSVFGAAGGGLCSMGSGDVALMSGSCYGSAGWFGNEIHNMNSTLPDHQQHESDGGSSDQKGQHSSDSGGGDSSNSKNNVFMDNSTLQIMDLGLSSLSSTSFLSDNWNPTLLLNMDSSEIQKEDSTTCDQSLSNSSGFPIPPSAPFGYPASSIIDSLFEPEHEQSIFNNNNRPSMSSCYNNNTPLAMAAASCSSSDWPNNNYNKAPMHFSNNPPYWNAASNEIRPLNFLPCTSQPKPTCPNLILTKAKEAVVKKASCNNDLPAFKRPRIETPSPLPVFKVRKEKLGDRITAIQQLVSPFGKTDTASVLYEAIEYIKFLHDQVNVLSTAYMKNGGPSQYHQQCIDHKLNKDILEVAKQDLRSKGLCLVPISSTFPVTNETASDFWTPTFGATFR